MPPNAAIILRKKGVTSQVVIKLTKPRELANGNISFRAKVLPTGAVMYMKTMDAKLPTGRFRNGALFIDTGDAPPCPAMITQTGWCTLSSSNDNSAQVTVDLETPNSANLTRTIQTCYWKGDHKLGALLRYREAWSDNLSYTLNKDQTPACNSPSFSNLNQESATWEFQPRNTYYLNGAFRYTRNKNVTFTLNSRRASYGGLWRFYSTPKVVLVVTDKPYNG